MNENVRAEIEKSAQYISMSVEEAIAKFEEICSANGLETGNPASIGVWRNYVANARRQNDSGERKDDSLFKAAFGFFVSLDAPRDMMAWNRNKAKEEFLRDEDNALEKGIVAVATENTLGKFVISRYHKNEYQEVTVNTLPEGAEIMEDGRIYIPLDNTATYMNGGTNANYGKPLPAQQMRRSGVFFGSVNNGEMRPYYFSYKNQGGVDFAPNTFEWVHFLCVEGSNGTDIYGATDLTVGSLSLNSELDPESNVYRNMDNFNFEEALKNHFDEHIIMLFDIDREHIQRQALPSKERYVITEGTVCNMNMMPTKNGNRIINITDLNTEMNYEDDSGMVTCWVPEHLTLDFGIGSTVFVVGRTSQRTIDGVVEPATINTSGIYCLIKHGSAVEVSQPIEEDFDWF